MEFFWTIAGTNACSCQERQDSSVGSEDKDDITFVGQRVRRKNGKRGPYSSADQQLAVESVFLTKPFRAARRIVLSLVN